MTTLNLPLNKRRFSDGLKPYFKCTLMILSVGQYVINCPEQICFGIHKFGALCCKRAIR